MSNTKLLWEIRNEVFPPKVIAYETMRLNCFQQIDSWRVVRNVRRISYNMSDIRYIFVGSGWNCEFIR